MQKVCFASVTKIESAHPHLFQPTAVCYEGQIKLCSFFFCQLSGPNTDQFPYKQRKYKEIIFDH